MVSTRITMSKSDINNLISQIKNTRKEEPEKNPYYFFQIVGIDFDDAVNIIKDLTYNEYKYTQYDVKYKFSYMHIFHKQIFNKIAYIKIGFKSDKTVVISFHEKMFEN